MEKILKLENNDDIASIRGRINVAFPPRPISTESMAGVVERQRLLIMIPRKNKTFQKLVNMKLLARIGQMKAIELAIVSTDPLVRDYAKEAGVKAFAGIKQARWAGWVNKEIPVADPNTTLPPKRAAAPEAVPPQPQERVQPKKYKVVQGRGRIGLFQQLGALVLLVVLAVGLVFGLIALLPQATVTLTPVAQPVQTELIVRADPEAGSVDFSNLVFPARIDQVELDLTGSIETVETQLAPVGKATGQVVLINRTDDQQIIPISTTVSTSAGEPIEFITTQTATIPAGVGATTPTLVIAVEPGPGGNVQPGQISQFANPSYRLRARVVNESSLSGGTMEAARIVVEDDKVRLQDHLRDEIAKVGLAQLEATLAEQEFIPAESIQVIVLDVTYEEFSGDFSETFSGEMQAVVRGTVVGGYNANRLALAALEAQVPPGFELDVEGLHFGAGEVLDYENRVVTFRIFADGMAIPIIDQTQIAEDIAWLSVGEAQEQLVQSYELATVPGIELSPDWAVEWIGRLPFVPLRINVIINDAITFVADNS